MDCTAYDQVLLGQMWFYIILGILGAGVCVGLLIFPRTERKTEGKKDKILRSLRGAAAVLLALLFLGKGAVTVYQTAYDVRHQAYITYEGVFEVDARKNSAYLTFACGGETLKLFWEAEDLPDGTYDGKILYAEKTGLVLQVWTYGRL